MKQMYISHTEIQGRRITYSLLPGYKLLSGFRNFILTGLENGCTTGLFRGRGSNINIGYWLLNEDISPAFKLKNNSNEKY